MSWHLASMSSSGSSPLARTATHSSMGSSVDARWSARFGVALSVSATCACGAFCYQNTIEPVFEGHEFFGTIGIAPGFGVLFLF